MATQEEITRALELFHENRRNHLLEQINRQEMGLTAVVQYLWQSAQERPTDAVTAKEISTALGVSTARMTVLLQNLEQKQLIAKAPSRTDARAITVSLTATGEARAQALRNHMCDTMARVVDELGVDALEQLFASLRTIQTILHENKPTNWEADYA